MKANYLRLNLPEMFRNCMLVEKPKPVFVYEGNHPTQEVDYYSCNMLLPECSYEKQILKVKILPTIEFTGTPVKIKAENLDGKVWLDYKAQEIRLSVTADSIEAIPQNNKIRMNKGEE